MPIGKLTDTFEAVARQIFQKDIEAIGMGDIDREIKLYPYFHFLYMIKMVKASNMSDISQYALQTPNALLSFSRAQLWNSHIREMEEHAEVALDDSSMDILPIPHSKDAALDPSPTERIERTIKESPLAVETTNALEKKLPPAVEGLKTFSDWLQSMHTLSYDEKIGKMRISEEVERYSQESIHRQEVATESMAEVWMLQGYPDKAIGVYEKLILLFPDKSSYFAGKIADIKTQFKI